MIKRHLAPLFGLFLLAGCEGRLLSPAETNTEPNVDPVMPTLSLVSPTSGSSITAVGPVRIALSASAPSGIARVELRLEGRSIGVDNTTPFAIDWRVTAQDNGPRTLEATAFDSQGNAVSTTFQLIVDIDNEAPVVAITSPADGTTFTAPQTVSIVVAAVDDEGVARVELYDGSTLRGTDDTAPYTFQWTFTNADNGAHSFTARAQDGAGNTTTSSAINLNVNIDGAAPSVAVSSPATDTIYTTAQTVTLTATASDNVGVTRVEFYDGATLRGTDTSAPYTFSWAISASNNGAHRWTARAYDADGNTATSSARVLSVNIDGTLPSVSISSPTSGSTYTTAQTVTLTATASDNVGVTRVEFYDGPTLRGTDTSAPFDYSWAISASNNGTHNWTARAYDAANNVNTSASVSLVVNISAQTASVPLEWDPNTEPDIASYAVHWGTASRAYSNSTRIGNITTHTVTDLLGGRRYYFAVTARNTSGLDSDYSNEVFVDVP
ncbi:MAG: Ig-like domain-containing protein [Myxococcaceae bacterium]